MKLDVDAPYREAETEVRRLRAEYERLLAWKPENASEAQARIGAVNRILLDLDDAATRARIWQHEKRYPRRGDP